MQKGNHRIDNRPRVIGDMDDYVESRYNELEALSSYRGEYDEKDD